MAEQATAETVLPYLAALDYPATKERVVDEAESAGAPEDVIRAVRALPLGDYASRAELVRSIGTIDPAEASAASRAARAAADLDKQNTRVAREIRRR